MTKQKGYKPTVKELNSMSNSALKELLFFQFKIIGKSLLDIINPFRYYRILRKAFRQLIGKE